MRKHCLFWPDGMAGLLRRLNWAAPLDCTLLVGAMLGLGYVEQDVHVRSIPTPAVCKQYSTAMRGITFCQD